MPAPQDLLSQHDCSCATQRVLNKGGGTETLACSDQIQRISGECFLPLQYLLCAYREKEDFFITMNKQSKKPPILSPKELSFTVEQEFRRLQRAAPSSGGSLPEGSSICLLYLLMFLWRLGWQSRLRTGLLAWGI